MNEPMAAVEATDKADDRAKRLLDYRYYHHYDLEMINVGGANGVPTRDEPLASCRYSPWHRDVEELLKDRL